MCMGIKSNFYDHRRTIFFKSSDLFPVTKNVTLTFQLTNVSRNCVVVSFDLSLKFKWTILLESKIIRNNRRF